MEADMDYPSSTCPLNRRQLVDEYFIENRTKLLDIAAFLDRLARAKEDSPEQDFRMAAFQRGLGVLSESSSSRVSQIEMIFSDPTTEPLEKLDVKSARGAYEERKQEVR
jgi:hypothetical protein